MQYLFLIYANLTREEVADLPAETQQQLWADWGAINQTPGVTPGTGMDAPATATTVRVQGGETLTTDGPFPDVKEALGGYFLFEADDLDDAIALAARVPTARMGGAVEIRPVV
jgi:hypothetical protein